MAVNEQDNSELNKLMRDASESPKLTQWKKEPNLRLLKDDFEAAKPSHDEQVARIKKWNELRQIEGQAKPPKIEGRSQIQPKLVRRQAEWRYAALSEPFLSSDKLFKVSPMTFEDTQAARHNNILLNWQFRTKLKRVKLIDDIIHSTVDDGTCILRLGWKRSTETVEEEVPRFEVYPVDEQLVMSGLLPDPQGYMAQLQQAVALKTENPNGFLDLPPEMQEAAEQTLQLGVPMFARQTGVALVPVERVTENRPVVEVMNPNNVYIDPSCEGDLDKALFVIVTFETNKAELLKDGRYKNLDRVNWEGNVPVTQSDHESTTPDTFNFKDETRKKVVAYEYWGFYDIEDNGVLHPIVVTWIGDTIIRMEENPFPDRKLPFVVIPYLPVKRDLYGEPDAEMLEENQKIIGAVTRGIVDTLANSANGQRGFPRGFLDPYNRRKFENGENYEYNPLNGRLDQLLVEHKYPEIPQSAMALLSMQNLEAESLTGVKSFSDGLSSISYGDVATGIRGLLDAASKREMAILRRIATGICEMGRKIMSMNAVFLSEEEVVRVTNEEFVTIRREDLPGEFDLQVDIATFEVDNTKAQDLGFMLQTLGPNMDPSITMQILSEIAELKRMPDLAHRLRTWRPEPDPLAEQAKQLELQKLQLEVAKLESEIMLNQANAQKAMADAGTKQLDAVEQSTGVKHARELQKARAQAQGNQDLEITKAMTKPLKEGERPPDLTSAIGWNALSRAIENEELGLRPPTPAPLTQG